jgi:phosphate ABC transporter phosphate-binding protein
VKKRKSLIPIFVILFVVLVVMGFSLFMYTSPGFFVRSDDHPPAVQLKTGGTATVFLILENRWRSAYLKDKGVDLQFESTGSTKGLTKMIDKDLAVAFSHAPMTEEQKDQARAKGGEVVQVPVVLCAVVPVYNVKDLPKDKPLKFSGEVLGKIFRGKIDKWNDPALQELQDEGVKLPDQKIAVVHREESSGTTFIFTEYLIGASGTWKEKFDKPASEVKWEVGEGQQRNEGVALRVKQTEGAIGYVDLVHALNYELPYAKIQNKDKTDYIHADAEKMTSAAHAVAIADADELTVKLTNQPGKDSYPITGVVWAVCYKNQPAADHKSVVDFLHWATHDGQQFAKNMSYAPLPPEFVERVDKKLESISASP